MQQDFSVVNKKSPSKIKHTYQVKEFFEDLLKYESLNFHPDTQFSSYINDRGMPTYTDAEAEHRDGLLERCFEVCDEHSEDIYDIANEVYGTD